MCEREPYKQQVRAKEVEEVDQAPKQISPCRLWRHHGGADIHTAAQEEHRTGAGACFLKELHPIESRKEQIYPERTASCGGTQAGVGVQYEEKGAAERSGYGLTITSPFAHLPMPLRAKGGRIVMNEEVMLSLEKKGW